MTFGGTQCYCSVPKGAFYIALNITSPHIHILGDNKTPALECFKNAINAAVTKAISRSARNNPPVLVSANGNNGDHGEDDGAGRIVRKSKARGIKS